MHGPVLHAVEIQGTKAAIYEALTTQAGQAAFWTSDVDLDAVVGSIARFGFPAAPVDLRMRIDALEPEHSVRWACLGDFPFWEGTEVSWELSDGPTGGVMVLFRHAGWPDDYPDLEFAKVNYTWGRIVGALQTYVETGTPQPFLG